VGQDIQDRIAGADSRDRTASRIGKRGQGSQKMKKYGQDS
jgi:hypothetical protein